MATAAPQPFDALHGAGLPADWVSVLADGCRIRAAAPPAPAAGIIGGRVLVLLGSEEDAADAALWAPPYAAWVEATSPATPGHHPEAGASPAAILPAVTAAVNRAGQAHLFASLSTATANAVHLAGRVMAAVSARCPTLTDTQRDDVELALHEAISNAVVHGNLQVAGMKGLNVDALDRFSHDLAERMADPAFAGRRVEVSCWLAPDTLTVDVTDEGSGFDPAPRNDAGPDASGRGLDLITLLAQSVELLDHGRRIRMRFTL
ncbi:anti-sigma regulatory factor (Ser/Thr protein kinase) [Azospirillum fermentarium]|uniref:ATP-binding protein n=1 Tax=Azospirillum fermentarium TaxID=1233114 RepID=UPI0022267A1A|nr:ATP-binding protein [Azospirillum fermentarium]MCW2245477.1 anti-sigma regulatory factor (Ser/Thr protein kinase) [Azospirillum fermentarium]